MFTHTSTSGFSIYLTRPDSFFFPLYIAVPFWVKTAVPIFFMISGALLLKKSEPISLIFKKRIFRFLQIIFIFSLINYIYFYHSLDLSFYGHISKFFTMIYSSNMATAYYFLYIYIGFLLMLPLWRTLVQSMSHQLFLYLIALNLFFVGAVPIISFLLFQGSAEINWFVNPLLAVSEPTFYFIIGFWIENILPDHKITKKTLLLLGIAALLGTALAAVMTCYRGYVAGGLTEALSERFYDSFLFLNSAFIYCFARWWFSHHSVSPNMEKLIIRLGSLSFGVMLFEEITRSLTRWFYGHILLTYIPRTPFIDAVIWICAAFALGLLLTHLIKKIPYFNRLI